MLINADFTGPVSITPDQYQWVNSPQGGVERAMLYRQGAEKARATSIVRYARDSRFPRHLHPGGEEILVLSGAFSEDGGHYPAGWYLRNPPGSGHHPFSCEGAIIFVKLGQMAPHEHHSVRIDTHDPSSWQCSDGREVCPLFSSDTEQVSLQRLSPNEALFVHTVDGAELLVLLGDVVAEGKAYPRGSWIRLPAGEYPEFAAGTRGATVYLRTGRLIDTTTGE